MTAQNKQLLREMRYRIVEEKLAEAVDAARSIELGKDELLNMLNILYEEE